MLALIHPIADGITVAIKRPPPLHPSPSSSSTHAPTVAATAAPLTRESAGGGGEVTLLGGAQVAASGVAAPGVAEGEVGEGVEGRSGARRRRGGWEKNKKDLANEARPLMSGPFASASSPPPPPVATSASPAASLLSLRGADVGVDGGAEGFELEIQGNVGVGAAQVTLAATVAATLPATAKLLCRFPPPFSFFPPFPLTFGRRLRGSWRRCGVRRRACGGAPPPPPPPRRPPR